MCELTLATLNDADRAQIVAAWARKTALENRRRRIRRALDIASMAAGLIGACALLWARSQGWL